MANNNFDYWVAVMKGGSLEPHKKSDGYAGYYCPNFKTRKECEEWIKDWNKNHPGRWAKNKAWLDTDNSEDMDVYLKGVDALGKKLIEMYGDESDELKRILTYLGVKYD